MEVERVAVEIGLEVNFGRETAARAAERLAMLPPFAPAAETWARAIVLSKSWTKCATLAHAPSGSSPRARGTHSVDGYLRYRGRFIPASAGNTGGGVGTGPGETVHPRERGEHFPGVSMTATSAGSSPRARGTQALAMLAKATARFIPASAGNTLTRPGYRTPMAVHPRERGEHQDVERHAARVAGSSPRARGTLEAFRAGMRDNRFIPASAGNTST